MNKLNVNPPALKLSPTSKPNSEYAHRLIVLLPASEVDASNMPHQIWEIARSLQLNVLLLNLSNDHNEEIQLRRTLMTMAAIIKDPDISTDIMVEKGNNWVRQVKKIWQTGDVVACFAHQKVGLMRRPLSQVLKSSLKTSVYILSTPLPN